MCQHDGNRMKIHPEYVLDHSGYCRRKWCAFRFRFCQVFANTWKTICQIRKMGLESQGQTLLDNRVNHPFGEPIRGVILAKVVSGSLGDNGLIERFEHVVVNTLPFEDREPTRDVHNHLGATGQIEYPVKESCFANTANARLGE